mgnify:CR=1 FL=1
MSKILRRPMFRGGGKVSSYGNGIATGLADGGRVNFQHGGTHAGLTLPQQKALIAYQKPGAQKYTDTFLEDRLNQYKNNLYTKDIPNLDIAYGMQMVPPMTDDQLAEARYFEETPEKFTEDFYSGKLDGTNYNKLQSDQLAAATLAGEQDLYKLINKETAKKNEPTQRTEAEIEADLLKKLKGKELTEGEELAALEKEQAFFEKLLGGGKAAMIDDLSTMGLNYASGALKEGATVKSSFADFFEKEAKRPSRRMKVKDAATQAAIQSYLTGKTSLQKFQNDLDGYSTKLEMKDKFDKKDLSIDNVLRAEAGNNGKVTNEGVMARSFDRIYKDVPGYAKFQGEVKPDKELIEGGIYYVTEGNDRIVYIVKNGKLEEIKTIFN